MGRFDDFRIDLKGMQETALSREYNLGNPFFINIDGSEFQKGKVDVQVDVKKKAGVYELKFHCKGVVYVPCDRCLDDIEIEVETNDTLPVKLGADYGEEGDAVIIPEDDGVINVAWYIYEFIALAIPMKHVHAPGKCNKEMMSRLKKHITVEEGDETFADVEEGIEEVEAEIQAEETDPRWDELKKITDIDDN